MTLNNSTRHYLLATIILSCVMVRSAHPEDKPLQISITKLTDSIYVHTSYKYLDGNPFPSNGMVISTSKGALLIDTGWDELQTQQLLSWIETNLRQYVVLCIISHYHEDRLGGMRILRERRIPVVSTIVTAELASKERSMVPDPILPDDTTLVLGTTTLRVCFPGEGHTKDNLVVWFPKEKILFGGCLVKSMDANGLGNIADANLAQWPRSIQKLEEMFNDAKVIIPGHQGWGGTELLKHTVDLLEQK